MKPTVLIAALLTLTFSAHAAEPRKKTPRATPVPDNTTGKPEPRSLSGRALPYKAKITAIDERAATFSSTGKGGVINIFAVTDKTTFTKDAKPATFTDLAIGNVVTGTRTRTLGGKWEVASVNILGLDATPKSRTSKKDPVKPAEPTPTAPTSETAPVPAPAPADAPKATEPAKPEEPKPDAKPEEKKPE